MNIAIMDFGTECREKTQHLHNLLSGFADLPEVRLLIVCHEDSALARLAHEKKIAAIFCKETKLGTFFTGRKLRWRMRKADNPWLIQCFDQLSLKLAISVAAAKNHVRVVYSAMHPEPVTDSKIFENIHLVHAVIADNSESATQMIASGFFKAAISVIPASIDVSAYSTRSEREDGRIIFACSDTLEKGRGYAQVLEALTYLYAENTMPEWELRIVGGGPAFEGFLEKARELGVVSRLAIFGGFSSQAILPNCDILIAPAEQSAGSSLSIKEAWASGLAVLCSDTPSQCEMVQDGENALLFQNGNAPDLADKMQALAKNQTLRAKLAQNGSEALQDYSNVIVLQKHLDLYQQALTPKNQA